MGQPHSTTYGICQGSVNLSQETRDWYYLDIYVEHFGLLKRHLDRVQTWSQRIGIKLGLWVKMVVKRSIV
jgi:hypothetical protein